MTQNFGTQIQAGMNSLKIIHFSFRDYPVQSLIVIVGVLLAGLTESVGILSILPLLNVSMNAEN